MSRLLPSLALALLSGLAVPAFADAHAFLVRSSPQAGERFAQSPATFTLEFSEAIVEGLAEVSVRTPDGRAVALGPVQLDATATTLRAEVPRDLRGVHLVAWQVLAQDGAVTLGEFAFGVGTGTDLGRYAASASAPVSWAEAVANWLLLTGLALAIGGLGSETFAWRPVALQHGIEIPRAPIGLGIGLALVGAASQLYLAAAGGGSGARASGASLGILSNRPAVLSAAITVLVLYALWLLRLRSLRSLVFLPLAGAVATIALRGHSGLSEAWWAVPANAAHLAAAGLWVGALLHLMLVLRRLDREEWRPVLGAVARRYASFALAVVLVAIPGGAGTAFAEISGLADLVETAYGRTLLAKLALIGVALALAFVARRRTLGGNPAARLPLLRRLTRVESVTLLAIVGISAVLVTLPSPRTAPALQDVLGAAPLSGRVVRLASQAGEISVYLAAAEDQLEIQLVNASGERARGAEMAVSGELPSGEHVRLYPRGCGHGCFSLRFPWREGRTRLAVDAVARGRVGGTAHFDVPWPASPDEPALLERVIATMRAERAVVLVEQTFSGPGMIGPRNVARLSGADLMALEPYAASGANDVRRLTSGPELTDLSLYLPGSYIWARLWIDRQHRLQRAVLVSPGHLIERAFFYGADDRGGT